MTRAYDSDAILTFIVQSVKARPDDKDYRQKATAALETAFKHAQQWGMAPIFHAVRDALNDVNGIGDMSQSSALGYCPHCGQPGELRERRIGGNDRCGQGHVYPSVNAISFDQKNTQPA